MPKKEEARFDRNKYNSAWSSKNLTTVSARYKPEFVNQFKQACKILGISQSEILRTAMQEAIDKAENISSHN